MPIVPASRYWHAPRLWHGSTVFILAGGASLRGFDRARLRGRRVIVVNYADLYPEADVMFAADFNAGRKWLAGEGQINATISQHEEPGVRVMKHTGKHGIDGSGKGLRMGGTSLHAAIDLAVAFGAARIVLLGADMRVADDGVTHWNGRSDARYHKTGYFEQHYIPCIESTVDPLRRLGIECVNASPGTALTCFPLVDIDDELVREEQQERRAA